METTSVEKKETARACEKVKDQDVYVLNPVFRLRNAKDHVLAFGAEGVGGTFHLHKATAIILALCDGKRTVADIARITRPFVSAADETTALAISKCKVKETVFQMSLAKGEKGDSERLNSEDGFPASTVLVTKSDYETRFAGSGLSLIDYDVKSFLPKDVSEIANANEVKVVHEHAPITLNWHLTSQCSTDCRYCYLGRRNADLLPKERTLELIDEAASIGVLSVSINGGDFLLYPHLDEVLRAFWSRKFLPTIVSTKSFLSKEKARLFAELRSLIWSVQFSIDSSVPEVADYMVGAKNYVDRIFASIDNAKEAGLRVSAKAVITPYNILTIPKLYRDLKKRGVATIRLASYCRSGHHHSNDLYNNWHSFNYLQKEVDNLKLEFPNDDVRIQNGAPVDAPLTREHRKKEWPQRSVCTAGRKGMMICADGKVIPCEQMPETEQYFCGDLRHQSIMEVWNGARLREMTYGMPLDKFKGQMCYECDERQECLEKMGTCIRDLSIHYGNIYQPPMNCPRVDLPFVRQF